MTNPFMAHRTSRRQVARAMLATALIGGVAAPFRVRSGAAQDAPAEIDPNTLGVMTVVVAGLDSRGPEEPSNNDVLMLARIDVPNRTVRAISIPRDLWVNVPGIGYTKVTRAYDHGFSPNRKRKDGMNLLSETVTQNFGVAVDGVTATTFGGFSSIVDAFGGIDVDNPYDLVDNEYPTEDYGIKSIYYPAGPQRLDGKDALIFARTRHMDGDPGRVMRQQLVLRAILERAREPEIAPTLSELATTHVKAVITNLGTRKKAALALVAPEFSNDGITFNNLMEYVYPGTAPDGQWIYDADYSLLPDVIEAMLNGELVSADIVPGAARFGWSAYL